MLNKKDAKQRCTRRKQTLKSSSNEWIAHVEEI